jgi:hypothetical protein
MPANAGLAKASQLFILSADFGAGKPECAPRFNPLPNFKS